MTGPCAELHLPRGDASIRPSRMTPISSASTLNAMPSTSPGNVTIHQSHTGSPDTLAMPVAILVIVPTSRGLSCGVNASRTCPIQQTPCRNRFGGSQVPCSLALCFGLRLFRFRLGFGIGLWPALASGLSFSFRSSSTPFFTTPDIRDAPRTFCPFVVSSMPLIKSGAVSNRTWISAEKVSLSAFVSPHVAPQAGQTRCARPRGQTLF